MEHNEMIISPYHGVVRRIYIRENVKVDQWEPLFAIETTGGNFRQIRVGLSGMIDSLEVETGDKVVPGMVLAYLSEDLAALGGD